MSARYGWIITGDLIDGGEVGTRGPGRPLPTEDPLTAGEPFRMKDDDGNLYYTGRIWGDHSGFEPLDDFGMPNAGCTTIEYRTSRGGWAVL